MLLSDAVVHKASVLRMDESPFFLFCHDLFVVFFLIMPIWHCCFLSFCAILAFSFVFECAIILPGIKPRKEKIKYGRCLN